MHRHGFKGRKLSRKRDQRRALLKSLATSLITNYEIKTTKAKALEVRSYVEKLITESKKDSLISRRRIIAKLNTTQAAHKLCDHIRPQLNHRQSGYLRIENLYQVRRGDGAEMVLVSFVDYPFNTTPRSRTQEKKNEK